MVKKAPEMWDIHLNDECREVGSGHRRVFVRSIGHKHVYLKEVRRWIRPYSRISRKVWDGLPKARVEHPGVNNLIYKEKTDG